jgi:hypothetical protein
VTVVAAAALQMIGIACGCICCSGLCRKGVSDRDSGPDCLYDRRPDLCDDKITEETEPESEKAPDEPTESPSPYETL